MALTDEYIARLKELKRNLSKIDEEISDVEISIVGLQNSIKYWRNLKNEPDSYFKADAFNRTIYVIAGVAKELLWKNIQKAIEETKEYDDPRFIEGLRRAVEDERTIVLEYNQNDFTIKDIKIDLNLTAGTLEEWAGAVKSARLDLIKERQGRYIKDSAIASHIWAEKIYGAGREGKTVYRRKRVKESDDPNVSEINVDVTDKFKDKYWKTIALRFSHTKSPAPWWQLLDKGNIALKGIGSPYPVNVATNFVIHSTLDIENYFHRAIAQFTANRRSAAEYEYSYAATRIKEVREFLKELRKLKEEFSLEKYVEGYIKGTPPPTEIEITQPFEKALEKTAQRLAELEKLEKADIPKLTSLIRNMVNGQFPAGKVRLGRDVRIRVKRIQNMVEAELGKWYVKQ